jgi:uncharacterized membrane protein YfcA
MCAGCIHMLGFDIPLSVPLILVAVVISGVAAAIQGVVGFGYAIVAVPLLSLLDPRFAPVPQILTALPLTVISAWRERRHIDGASIGWILTGRVPGIGIGAILVAAVSPRELDALIGLFVLASVACLSTGGGIIRNRLVDTSVGAIAGVSGYVSGIGGPPLALLYRDASGPIIRSTLGVLFAVGILVTVATRAAMGQVTLLDLYLAALLLAPVVLGTWASRFLHGIVEGRGLRVSVLVLCTVAGVGLLLRASVG